MPHVSKISMRAGLCIAGAFTAGCALPGITSDYDPGANGVGGGNGGTVGVQATGGATTVAGASNGGVTSAAGAGNGGASNNGGSSGMGGRTEIGGTSPIGGVSSIGGSAPQGGSAGNATGGISVIGGFTSTAGSTAVGGSSITTGGTGVGGSKPTGGISSIGGTTGTVIVTTGGTKPTGGASSAGGLTAIGGSTPSGGAVTGGAVTGGTANGGSSSTPLMATSVAIGYGHACAVIADGSLWCWGNNSDGELGNGASVDGVATVISAVPVKVVNVSQATNVSTGNYHSCAVLSTGKVQCWGYNGTGQLGNGQSGTDSRSSVPVAVKVDGVNDLTSGLAVVAGSKHSCALLKDSSVKCWGDNGVGQLGSGNTSSSTIPVDVITDSTTKTPLTGVSSLAVRTNHTCAVQSGGAVYCWGDNDSGQLGNRTTNSSTVAVKAVGVTASAVGAGDLHSCAVSSAAATLGAVQCWGYNYWGQLGNNSETQTLIPATATTSSPATMLALGTSYSCAVLNSASASIECWGENTYGQLGNATDTYSTVPVPVRVLTQVKSIAAGEGSTCAVTASGVVYCWGDNWFGELGDGNGKPNVYSTVPVRVLGF